MSSAVLDRVLAIPDYDDLPQMGLSKSGLAALVERGGITTDGTKAKASVLKRADVKGDRKLPPLTMDTKGLTKRDAKRKTGKLLRDIRNNKITIGAIQGKGKRAYIRVKGEKTLLQKRAMTDRDIARNAGITAARLEAQGQGNLFNQPKSTAIAEKAISPANKALIKKRDRLVSDYLAEYPNKDISDVRSMVGGSIAKEIGNKARKGLKLARFNEAKDKKLVQPDLTPVTTDSKTFVIGNTKKNKTQPIRGKKREKTERDIRIGLEQKGQGNLFNQPKSTAIAPDTAKKIKRANKFEQNLKAKLDKGIENYSNKQAKKRLSPEAFSDYAKQNVKDDVVRESRRKLIDNTTKLISPTREKGRVITSSKGIVTRKKREKSAADTNRDLERKGQLNIFGQPKPSKPEISVNTAKKVKQAIAGVKGGKVVKGQMPVSGRVIESGKVGKDGFAKATISIPLHSRRTKSGFALSEPTKGERIGDYHVSRDGNRNSGYSITHIPSGTMVLNANVLKGELGNNDKETAKRAAKKLHEAQIPLPKTFKELKKLQTTQMRPRMQEIGRKVLSSIK